MTTKAKILFTLYALVSIAIASFALLDAISILHVQASAPDDTGIFRANKCGRPYVLGLDNCPITENQKGLLPNEYNLVEWPSVEGSRFTDNRWTPVRRGEKPRNVSFVGQLFIHNAKPGNGVANYVARIWKNGDHTTSLGALVGLPHPYFKDTFVVPIAFQDRAQPGDTYEVRLHVSSAEAEIDRHPLHTFWGGQ